MLFNKLIIQNKDKNKLFFFNCLLNNIINFCINIKKIYIKKLSKNLLLINILRPLA